MNSLLNWDEFRLVKAVADARSLVGAAQSLGLNHSTVFRRLASIEGTVGARLFERSRGGYQATAAGEEMIHLATRMGESILDFERRVAGRDVKPTGELHVSTVDSVAVYLLPPILARFRSINPGVQLDLALGQENLNMSRRDADVAIRATAKPPETLVGRRICALRWGVYCAADFANEWGQRLFEDAPWIGFGESFGSSAAKQWIDANIGPRRQSLKVNSAVVVADVLKTGLGAALLPCFVGDRLPGVVRRGDLLPDIFGDVWILTHADLRFSPRVRAFMDFVGNELAKQRPLIEGLEAAGG
jgi:DNA-binding transcriptional LysR family regulator